MHKDNPDLTTYALGEMPEAERAVFEEQLQFQPELNEEIEAIAQVGRVLASGLSEDPHRLTHQQREVIWKEIESVPRALGVTQLPARRTSPLAFVVGISAAAACLALAFYLFTQANGGAGDATPPPTAAEPAPVESVQQFSFEMATAVDPEWPEEPEALPLHEPVLAPEWKAVVDTVPVPVALAAEDDELPTPPAFLPAAEALPALEENDFVAVAENPETDLPVKSGKASYPWVRGYLDETDNLPPRDAVRIEELVNAFPYSEPRDETSGRVAVGMRLVDCPWDGDSWLLGILLRNTSAVDDVQIKARLHVVNRVVSDYKLLGFAQPQRDKSGLQIPSILDAGKSQFVIYQLKKRANYETELKTELATLSVRSRIYGRSWDTSRLVCRVENRSWLAESNDFRFAALMTAFGEALRDDNQERGYSLDSVADMADVMTSATPPDQLTATQREAMDLIRKAKRLSKELRR